MFSKAHVVQSIHLYYGNRYTIAMIGKIITAVVVLVIVTGLLNAWGVFSKWYTEEATVVGLITVRGTTRCVVQGETVNGHTDDYGMPCLKRIGDKVMVKTNGVWINIR